MKTKKLLNISLAGFVIILLVATTNFVYAQEIEKEIESYTKDLPFPFPELSVPSFPSANYNIVDFGAVADGLTKNTEAINKAITECSEKGGGHVIVPPGLWITGAIALKNNVDLHLEKGAMVIFSSDHKDFPLLPMGKNYYDVMNPIYGRELNNIALTGDGIFDGNGQTWRPVKKSKMTPGQWKELVASGGVVSPKGDMWWPNEASMNAADFLKEKKRNELTLKDYEYLRDFNRPYMFRLEDCKNILLDNITLQNSPKFAMNLRRCENIIVRNVKVMNEWWAQNGDGLDFSACKNVVMYGCTVNAGDDGLCMKSSRYSNEEYGMENIVIADCVVYHAHGGFVIGSNTDGGIRNISVKNCNFTWTDVGLRFKSGLGRGGKVENIYIDGVYMKELEGEAILFDMFYADAAAVKMKGDKIEEEKIPQFQNIFIKNLYCDGAKQAVLVRGLENFPVKNIHISNSVIKSKRGMWASEAEGFVFDNVKIIPELSPVFYLTQSSNFSINKPFLPAGINTFMKLDGTKSNKIQIKNSKGVLTESNLEVSGGNNQDKITLE